MYSVRGHEYSMDEIEAFVMDSVVDGLCDECPDVQQVEPDAADYSCQSCGAKGSVSSVLILLELI